MTDKKKQGGSPAPQLGDIAAELAAARAKAGVSHSDLHRLTGISRSVLFGYENGRTKPGAKEIRLLCDALKVSPNRLIYGSDESQFKDEPSLIYEIGLDKSNTGEIGLATLMRMLNKEEHLALLTLTRSILVARHGKQVLDQAVSVILSISDIVKAVDLENESRIYSRAELEGLKEILEEHISNLPPDRKKRSK